MDDSKFVEENAKIHGTTPKFAPSASPLTTRRGLSSGGLLESYPSYLVMKNGVALKGHRRVLIALGARRGKHPPSGGWDVSCICGWSGGNFLTAHPAKLAYREHLDQEINQGFRCCVRCHIEKSGSEMRADYRWMCRACFSKLGNEWQKRNPNASAAQKRKHHLLRKFGITQAEADALLAEQDGVCAICRQPIQDTRGWSPHVDHDHETGRVRGILCFGCNVGLGNFADDPVRLRSAAEYLERFMS